MIIFPNLWFPFPHTDRQLSLTSAFVPPLQDMKLRQIVTMGSVDTLEQKTVTVCYGTDFVNVNFVNFCCTRRDIAQVSNSRTRWGILWVHHNPL